MASVIFKQIANRFPGLKVRLDQAEIPDKPEDFIKKSIITATYVVIGIALILYPVVSKTMRQTFSEVFFSGITIAILVLYAYLLYFFLNYPNAKIILAQKLTSREVVYAGRFLIIEIESGMPIYDSFITVSRNYKAVGKYFTNVTNKVDLGTDMETALDAEAENCPDPNLKKIFWQMLNSIKTGANISISLNTVLDQIVREQQVEVEEYGRKLNPIAMFYMIVAVILPSLGMTMLMVMATFVGFKLDLAALLVVAGCMGFLQFLFLATIKSSRPASGED